MVVHEILGLPGSGGHWHGQLQCQNGLPLRPRLWPSDGSGLGSLARCQAGAPAEAGAWARSTSRAPCLSLDMPFTISGERFSRLSEG